jgi:hypothetical protein
MLIYSVNLLYSIGGHATREQSLEFPESPGFVWFISFVWFVLFIWFRSFSWFIGFIGFLEKTVPRSLPCCAGFCRIPFRPMLRKAAGLQQVDAEREEGGGEARG